MKRRNDGKYCKTFTWNKKRYYCYGDTQKEARAKAEKRLEELKEGVSCDCRITFEAWFKEWVKKREDVVKPCTIMLYGSKYNRLKEELGKYRLNEIDAAVIRGLIDKMKDEGLRTSSINLYIETLRTAFSDAVIEGRMRASPMESIRKISDYDEDAAKEGIHRCLSKEEEEKFFDAAKCSRYYNLFILLKECGCRCGELLACSWEDVDFENKMLHIHKTVSKNEDNRPYISMSPKNKHSNRFVPLSEAALESLENQKGCKNISQSPDSLVFANKKGELAMVESVDNTMKHICKKAGIMKFTSHGFRHMFATRKAAGGMEPMILARILGHSGVSMLYKTYYHMSDDILRKEMERVSYTS